MAIRSRRKAREAALTVLYEVEIGHMAGREALERTFEETDLAEDLRPFATELVKGVLENVEDLDDQIAPLIKEYSYDRVAAIDRNVMRIAAFELFFLPAIPPAVTLNEAIDIAKKYSTAESGKFVNGVLGRLLKDSPKAEWDPATAPEDEYEEREKAPPEVIEVEEVEVSIEEAKKLAKIGGWTLRSEEAES